MIYLDNAATSYPKPQAVIDAVKNSFADFGANPGRSGHNLSVRTAMEIYEARELLSDFFDGYGAEYVSFTINCTHALNTAIKGILRAGDHCVISSLEHNSVARPVQALADSGLITYSVFDVGSTTEETLENFKNTIKTNIAIVKIFLQ